MKAAALLSLCVFAVGCADSASSALAPSDWVPAPARRAYEGAPPVVPHPPLGADCVSCHTPTGMAIEGIGLAPAMPHAETAGLSAQSRCRMCHVFRETEALFVQSDFRGFRRSSQAPLPMQGPPPGIPHPLHMHEDCLACHDGSSRRTPATTHPERPRCVQCHVPQTGAVQFERAGP